MNDRLRELRAHADAVGSPDDREEARSMVVRVQDALMKPKPEIDRAKKYLAVISVLATAGFHTIDALTVLLDRIRTFIERSCARRFWTLRGRPERRAATVDGRHPRTVCSLPPQRRGGMPRRRGRRRRARPSWVTPAHAAEVPGRLPVAPRPHRQEERPRSRSHRKWFSPLRQA